ncbi:MAG: 4-hydroxybenzoate polyprenyltransferase [Bdellovibrionaceae bacterium]|nr:4-hydroxybenzoate polyprenyltransferase [Pseudobdellovibrionaceae bacterium]
MGKVSPASMTNKVPLCVDLDHSFFKTDTLWEQLIVLLKERPWLLFPLILSMFKGKAAFKTYVCDHSPVDVSNYPVNKEVLQYIETEKLKGRPIVLATAAHEKISVDVLKNFEIFDRQFSSCENVNLGGQAKARLLKEEFGEKGFDYIGDHPKDLKIWSLSQGAVLVGQSEAFGKRLHNLIFHIKKSRSESFLKVVLRAMRVHQWIKNILIFLPMVLAHSILSFENWALLTVAALTFSFTASAVYIFNDLFDLNNDRLHPSKKNRPLASGDLQIPQGIALAFSLLVLGISGAFLVHVDFGWVVSLYFVTNLFYSSYLKKVIILDVFFLGFFYTIRILSGGIVIGVEISAWLKLFSFFFFSGLGYLKRFSDLKFFEISMGRRVLEGRNYHIEDLPIILLFGGLSTFASVLIFSLYIYQSAQASNYNHPEFLWIGVLALLYWTNYIWMVANRGQIIKDPVKFVLKDRTSLFVGVFFLLSLVASAI